MRFNVFKSNVRRLGEIVWRNSTAARFKDLIEFNANPSRR